jgi:hypothetical protein
MLILAIVITILAAIVSWVVFMANAMSDSSAHDFEGGWLVAGAWLATAAFWIAWWVG